MKIYAFGGLGNEEELFSKLDFGSHDLCFMPFEISNRSMTLNDFLESVLRRIDISKPFILLGFSFGGIIAKALAEKYKPERLILISTFLTRPELPRAARIAALKRPYLWLPKSMYSSANIFTRLVFSFLPKKTNKLVLKIMENVGPDLSKWAFKVILQWKGNSVNEFVRIHGERDRIIPSKKLKSVDYYSKGGHFMVHTCPEEMNAFLKTVLVF
ncbi:MAG: pimeloyl-ACP methyl ester carboxylesterase [Candidatus Azotimanducaceae bacterium]